MSRSSLLASPSGLVSAILIKSLNLALSLPGAVFAATFFCRPSLLHKARFHTLGVWPGLRAVGGPALFGRLHKKPYLEAKRRPFFSDRVGLGWRSDGVIGFAELWQNPLGGGREENLRCSFWPGGGPAHCSPQRESKRVSGFSPPGLASCTMGGDATSEAHSPGWATGLDIKAF